MHSQNYGLRKTWLDKCLKSGASQYPSTSNIGQGPKICSNLKDGTLTISVNYYDCN